MRRFGTRPDRITTPSALLKRTFSAGLNTNFTPWCVAPGLNNDTAPLALN
jgi:hypothetical protein